MQKSVTLDRNHLDSFKSSWPCHGLPDSLHSVRFEFATNGDLVDIEAKARNGRVLDTHAFDGPAMVALSQDAQAMEPETVVIFRMDDSDCVAVFPMEIERNGSMGCYAHIGQHGSCSYDWYWTTKPATEEEFADLKRELESAPYGYRFKVLKRIPRA